VNLLSRIFIRKNACPTDLIVCIVWLWLGLVLKVVEGDV